MVGTLQPINVVAGVESPQDRPTTTTQHFSFTKAIRFIDGFPEKIGGWRSVSFDMDSQDLSPVCRSIFPYALNNRNFQLFGTSANLYATIGSRRTNITPFQDVPEDVPNSLDTNYGSLPANPISTTSGSTTIVISDPSHAIEVSDVVRISGSSSVNGVPDTEINGDLFVREIIDANSYSAIIATPATSTGSGGGASVIRSTGIVTVNSTAHGLSDSDRVGLLGASDLGGIPAAEINLEFIIRNTQADSFDVVTEGFATSLVTGGGGASAQYLEPIPPGLVDAVAGEGYGAGLYGEGLYGDSKLSLSTQSPQIWSHGRFGDLVISNRGDSTPIYSWDSNLFTAPTPIPNAPTEVNYAFVSDNIVVALGYSGVDDEQKDNGITWSDQGGITNWTTQQAGSDVIEGAERFISHISVRGENLLFTRNQVYTFRYIGGQFIWQTRLLASGIGLVGQNARAEASGIAFWMAENNNFYMYRGAGAEVIPSNSGVECSVLEYVFSDFNYAQRQKVFAWFNPEYREIWWHYPSANSNEPNRVVRLHVDTFAWSIDDMNRTAADYPVTITPNPTLTDDSGAVYLHEDGLDDDGEPLEWILETGMQYKSTNTAQLLAFVPDMTFNGNVNVDITTRDYPLSGNKFSRSYIVTPSSDRVSTSLNGRYWSYRVSGNELGQSFIGGRWLEEVQQSAPK